MNSGPAPGDPTRLKALRQEFEQQLRRNTVTLGSDPTVELVAHSIDWQRNPPLIRARVRVTDPQLPTGSRVADVQSFINRHQAPRRYRLVVERIAVDLIGPETAPNPRAMQLLSPPKPPAVAPRRQERADR